MLHRQGPIGYRITQPSEPPTSCAPAGVLLAGLDWDR